MLRLRFNQFLREKVNSTINAGNELQINRLIPHCRPLAIRVAKCFVFGLLSFLVANAKHD